MARGRDDIDDAALAALLDHQPCDMLGEQKSTGENDRQLTLPFVERHVDDALSIEDGGAVYEAVDAAKSLTRRSNGCYHLALIGHVAGHGGGASAGTLEVTHAVFGVIGARIDAHERRPCGRETLRDTAPDVGAGPRNQRNLFAEFH